MNIYIHSNAKTIYTANIAKCKCEHNGNIESKRICVLLVMTNLARLKLNRHTSTGNTTIHYDLGLDTQLIELFHKI